jgi:hypothetical protein
MTEWIEAWITAMISCNEGKAILSNILYDCQEKRINPTKTNNPFYSRLQDILPQQQEFNAIQAFKDAICEEDFYRGQEIHSNNSEEYSRVMNFLDFRAHNLDLTKIPLAIDDQPLTSEKIQRLERVNLSRVGRGNMQTRRSFAWITKTTSLKNLIENISNNDVASCVRDNLGLHHLRDNQIHLVEIIYSQEVISQHSFHRPTFFEGCPSYIYRSINTIDGWGSTVNLNTYEEALPEAVHPSISFGQGFRLNYLG